MISDGVLRVVTALNRVRSCLVPVRLYKWAPDCAALRSPCGGAVLLCPQPSGTEPLSAHTSSYSAPEDTHKSE